MNDRLAKAEKVFHEALELPPEQREGFLRQACGEDAELLLDLQKPRRILGRCGQVFVPEKDFEKNGFVPNVVFPTALIQKHDTALVYYGAADTYVGVVEFSMPEILSRVGS